MGLSRRQWLLAGLIVAAVLVSAPGLWERAETFDPDGDYRIPYALSEDYWLYGRYARVAAGQDRILVVGDSVVWGQYVKAEMTLSGRLNALTAPGRFANLGLDGAHPTALAGLIEHHAGGLGAARVVLHLNCLWLATARHDLRGEEALRFNHPRLVPQFIPRIGSYDASVSERLAVLAGRAAPFGPWARHLRAAYFDNTDLPRWTVEHPYDNPLGALRAPLPAPQRQPRHRPGAWTARGGSPADFPWVDLPASVQWRSFRRAVEILRARGSRVFVLLGPFNEHMLTAPSRRRFEVMRRDLAAWLREQGLPHAAPPALPADMYADASHPLGPGYAALARQLLAERAFAEFASRATRDPVTATD